MGWIFWRNDSQTQKSSKDADSILKQDEELMDFYKRQIENQKLYGTGVSRDDLPVLAPDKRRQLDEEEEYEQPKWAKIISLGGRVKRLNERNLFDLLEINDEQQSQENGGYVPSDKIRDSVAQHLRIKQEDGQIPIRNIKAQKSACQEAARENCAEIQELWQDCLDNGGIMEKYGLLCQSKSQRFMECLGVQSKTMLNLGYACDLANVKSDRYIQDIADDLYLKYYGRFGDKFSQKKPLGQEQDE